MPSINFVVLGDQSIGEELGKKGSVTDMTFYERKAGGRVSSFIHPSGFPEKVQPLMQAIALAEYAILNVAKIDRELGEQIVALDSAGMSRGFVIPNGMEDDLRKVVKGTVVEGYEFLSKDEMRQRVESLEQVSSDGPAKVVVDAAFEVKGVGTVALGVVRRGAVRKHDEMEVFPGCKTVTVRSIQMHDDDVDSAESPARVGLALKGTDAGEVPRGAVIAAKGSLRSESSVRLRFQKSMFYRQEILPASSYHLCVGLQIKPVKVSVSGDELACSADKPMAFEAGERCVLLDLNSGGVRIVGSGTVL